MISTADDSTTSGAEVDALSTVQAFFDAMSRQDLQAVASLFSDDATWNHRNQDRFEGIHRGPNAILGYIGESVRLTNGTLRPAPKAFMPDGERRVAVLVQLSGTRPDGRHTDEPHIVLFTAKDGRISAVEHFVGDPAGAAAFWA